MNNPPLDSIQQPWVFSPYSLISWWDMEQFSAVAYLSIISEFHQQEEWLEHYAPNFPDSHVMHLDGEFGELLMRIRDRCQSIRLAVSVQCVMEMQEPGLILAIEAVRAKLQELRNTIRREMSVQQFFHMPPKQVGFYSQPELFGAAVNKRFPSIQYDMVEAGNCYAMGRGTAAVFHLMRIMEVGVQEFGKKLGVALASEKNWQNILDGINKAIKGLPAKAPGIVEMSQAAANLYAVKLAWRNEVMHPKDTYTLDEAENLIGQVKLFMRQLETII